MIERIAEFEKLEKEDYIKAFLEKRADYYPDKETATKIATDWCNNITIPSKKFGDDKICSLAVKIYKSRGSGS